VPRDFKPILFAATEVAPSREAPVPVEQPGQPDPGSGPPGRLRWAVWAAMVVAAAATVGLLIVRSLRPAQENAIGVEAARPAIVEQKDFGKAIRFHGIVEAVESHLVAAPRLSGQGLGTLIITKLAANGSAVHRGDVLVEFDRQAQLRNVVDKQAEYRDLEAQIKKKQADQAAARASDETELKTAEDAEKTAELEVKKNEILSKIDAEKNLQNLEQARATLQELKQAFDLKRRAAKADLTILEIQRDRALAAMRWAQANTEKMVIHSPVDGIAVINSMWKGGSPSDVQEGDEVRPGFGFMQVVNPSQMRVRARVNQADIDDLNEGQQATIHLDAYPDLSFSAKVERIAAVAQTSAFYNKVRVFTVYFLIDGSDPKLLPDLSAGVDVQMEHQTNALVSPRDAIFSENGQDYVLVKNGSGYEKREVKVGSKNDVEQVILSGVGKGAVLWRNPRS
jgi:HlyD family secretion protein